MELKQFRSIRILGWGVVLILVCVLFTVNNLVAQTSRITKPGEVNYRKGKAFEKKSQCRLALVEFDRAIKADPSEPKYYVARAECAYVTEWFDVMSKSFAGSGGSQNKEVLAHETASWLSRIDGYLAEALRLDPSHAQAYFFRAKWYSMNYQRERSYGMRNQPILRAPAAILADFDRAIELEPKNTEFYVGRGEFYLWGLDDKERGFRDYATAIKLQPKNINYLKRRAENYRMSRDYKSAVGDLTAILKLNPRSRNIRSTRADCYLELGEYADALNDINAEMRYFPKEKASALHFRASVYRKMGKVELAEADVKRAKAMKDNLNVTMEGDWKITQKQ
jgi:tetratricopeptide (TPR) repeat protein